MRKRVCLFLFAMTAMSLSQPYPAFAWEHHPVFTEPVLSTMTEVTGAAPVAAVPLESFLTAVETELAILLDSEEAWARDNVASYKQRPDALAFHATGTSNDICDRFFRAIRVNPGIKVPLYTSPLAGAKSSAKCLLAPGDVSILQDTSNLTVFDFRALTPGEPANPLDVVAAASNEPDYGLDIGLFEDNKTSFGQEYGFGVQPFGNPNLDYGSQAPFHMGFYHEAGIVYLFASFLKESYPEYRIHLFKSLSEFAFSQGQDYWGWRFMGWGLHYLGDLSMPYHTAALPGHSTLQMLWINLLDMMGWPGPKADAMQISSNRHMALEIFEGITLADAVRRGDMQNPSLAALLEPRTVPAYADYVPRFLLSPVSYCMTGKVDRAIERYMPAEFVSDPSVELADVPERHEIVDMMDPGAATAISALQAEAFETFAIHSRSYARTILCGTD